MKFRFIPTAVLAMALTTMSFAAEPAPNVGIVNFASCVSDSKIGKQEQASFEGLKKQMSSLLEDTEKQLNELATKFNDAEFVDSLSPEAEEELKNKFRSLNEDLGRYQNQYYQVLNQANMKIVQTISTNINTAAEKVAKDKKLNLVVNKDACFFSAPTLDITSLVVAEMDKTYEQILKQAAAPAQVEQQAVAKTEETKAK